ncbi:MAG: tRNA (adenosine(37)-N6)-threonylcarbamoyltransferase complex dimerization subunit type 1 TsaB [Byssovorax sp.]
MKILALSTSTPRGSSVVLEDDTVLGTGGYVDLQGHAERLFEALDRALAAAGLDRSALAAVAVDQGPGSFTGVRVGVASAKGIALGLALPLLGVISLEAMAAAAFGEGAAAADDVVVAAIDARKDEVFVAAYTLVNGGIHALAPPRCAPRAASALDLPGETRRIVIVGEVVATLDPLPPGLARGPALDLPDAAWVGRLAARRLASGEPSDPALVEPLYVRPPDAKPLATPTREDPPA